MTVVCREGKSQVEHWTTEIHRFRGVSESQSKRLPGGAVDEDFMTGSTLEQTVEQSVSYMPCTYMGQFRS